jgi:NADH-quinone oxidoreductase subunit M
MIDFPLLSVLIWLPVAGGVALLAMQALGFPDSRPGALLISGATFLLSTLLYTHFDTGTAAMQFQELAPWIETFNANYHLGVDGISMPLIILTTFTTLLVVLAGWEVIKEKTAQYMAAFLIMEGLMNGVFAALDAVLFYVFWEAMLVPMFLIIGIWGGPRRVYATIKFFLYTFFGSVFMLVALIYMYLQSGSFDILDFQRLPLDMTEQVLIFIAFLMAFAVKVPMWPVHTWLPDAHVEAPTGGSVILAAIMLKIGGYGFLRFSLPITPDASHALDWVIILMSLVAVVYIGLVALVQEDMKKLIAYSSIAHMGFVTLGVFLVFTLLDNSAATPGGIPQGAALGMEGGMVQMISHGFISGALFLCVGVLYDRLHSRQIGDYGGVVNTMPVFAVFMVLFSMANSGLPGTSGFVGEFMVILASYKANFWFAFLAATTLILGAAYSLWLVKRVIFGAVVNEGVRGLEDINKREFVILASLAGAVLLFGIWPAPLVEVMHASVDNLIVQVSTSKLPETALALIGGVTP